MALQRDVLKRFFEAHALHVRLTCHRVRIVASVLGRSSERPHRRLYTKRVVRLGLTRARWVQRLQERTCTAWAKHVSRVHRGGLVRKVISLRLLTHMLVALRVISVHHHALALLLVLHMRREAMMIVGATAAATLLLTVARTILRTKPAAGFLVIFLVALAMLRRLPAISSSCCCCSTAGANGWREIPWHRRRRLRFRRRFLRDRALRLPRLGASAQRGRRLRHVFRMRHRSDGGIGCFRSSDSCNTYLCTAYANNTTNETVSENAKR